MPYTEVHIDTLSQLQKTYLLKLAREAIQYGLNTGSLIGINFEQVDTTLLAQGCSFVTLHKENELRGCVGALAPYQSLIKDVIEHAFGAAFRDYRFHPVTQDELAQLHIEISVLTPQEPIFCKTEKQLLDQIQPHKDGLTIEDGAAHATFLPTVWDSLPNKETFLEHLKQKAGLTKQHWSKSINVYRYHTISFAE